VKFQNGEAVFIVGGLEVGIGDIVELMLSQEA
jgi:hypothetical protein